MTIYVIEGGHVTVISLTPEALSCAQASMVDNLSGDGIYVPVR